MNYSRIYRALVQRARDRSLTGDAYTETHHIVPKAFGGDDSLANLVVLTGREHFIAHWLLHRIYRGTDTEEESKAIFAFWRMSNQGLNASDKFRVTSFAYEEARVAAATKTAQLHSQRFQDPQLRRTTAEKTKASWARMTDEDRKKRVDNLSKAQKRRFQNNPQLRQQMSQQTRKRFEDNPELRKEVAAKTKEQFMDPEQRRQASERATKQFSSTAAREEMGKRTSALWANPDFREKLVKANQKRWRQPGSKDKYIDETLFVWKHSEHGTVRATRYDLKEKYQLTSSALSDLVFSSQPSYKGWSVVSAIIDGIEVDVRIWAETKGAERANVARRDPKVYTWSHQDHGVIQCTQYDFRRRFELNKKSVSKLVNGKLKTLKGWSLIERPEEG